MNLSGRTFDMHARNAIVIAEKPSAFDSKAIDEFVALVLVGGEVLAQGLRDRVLQAESIALLKKDDQLLGVAGLKRPTRSHRAEVFERSRTVLDAKEFLLELGWVYVVPIARGQGHSLPLCSAVVDAATGSGVFATSRVENHGMHRTLAQLGFDRVGREWPLQQNQGNLALFVRPDGA
ncbi:GNAT family N-acetyltransferase [Rhodanobacter sp. Soil772]|uniref:GNAT family N-acetyltransferase n=1 Tax=Rhodanobacter sp. Soil772 TaxID=1736406 RepID=UPI0012FAE9CA|nr:GNAT family N-acetyltransferase [Rhodanobacter sp. Soil772]